MKNMKNMKKVLLLSLVCSLLLTGCGKVPKLQNGEDAFVTFKKGDKEHQISAEDVFNELKDKYGLEAVINLIDTYVYETEFADYKEKARTDAENSVDATATYFGGEESFLEALRSQTNFQTIEAYKNYVYLLNLQSHGSDEYTKTLIDDKEIEDYYKNEAKGDIEVYHILITPQVKDDMTTTEKSDAEKAAKEKAQEVIDKLKDADDKLEEFKKLVKEYSEDEETKDKDGNLGYINIDFGDEYDELIKEAYKLKDGEYSKSVITTKLGYHVIYRNASKEKESLDDLRDEIIDILVDRKQQEDSKIYIKSLKYYRELYNMNIVDDEIDRQYGIYVNNLLTASTDTEE